MKKSIVTRWVAAAAVAVASLVAVPAAPATAAPGGSGIVINELYNNGSESTSAAFKSRYFELYNPTDGPISVDGWSLQYKSAGGATFSSKTNLVGKTIAAGGYLLISGGAAVGGNGADLPTPDVVGALNTSGSNGVVALSKTTTLLTTAGAPTDPNLVDLVGYGTANLSEGTAVPTGGSPTTSITRNAAHADTDVNSADFTASVPPTPCSSTGCYVPPVDPPADPPVARTIEDIQGDGASSPLDGTLVTTTGVVTAVYPEGGLNGGFIQTPGTGGAAGGTSHGLFIFDSAFAKGVEKGDHVEVTGKVSEFQGLTEVTTKAGDFTVLDTPAAAPVPTQVTFPLAAAAKEALESMVVAPQGEFTITNNFSTNQYGEIGLAPGDEPFPNPTNVVDPGAPAQQLQAQIAEDVVTLDDASSINFLSAATPALKNIALPWLTATNEIRVGQSVTFDGPVVLDFRNSLWKLQPLQQVTAGGADPVVFGPSTRDDAPEDVGGNVTIGTFNVLNYFTTTVADFEAAGLGDCSTFDDRAGKPVTADSCDNNGPRGAADDDNLKRQQDKIVHAINALDTSVVSLEEIENSINFGPDRDQALSLLVDALNADAGSARWEFVPSPAQVPTDEDVIRTAFIYQPATVTPVGSSKILIGATAFDNAREPLAQTFKPVGGDDDSPFVVIVNHFKSKSSGTGAGDADTGDGQGASNGSRVRQAQALVTFADDFSAAAGTDKVFLTGDFNAYSKEQPVKVLEAAGYVNVPKEYTDKETYQFGGGIGSLDHVFASAAADASVTGADIWNINAYESVAREYSRFNYNLTNFYDDSPFRASDHDPTLIGYDAGKLETSTTATAPASVRAGDDLTVSVDVTGPDEPTGTVTVTEGDVEVGSGTLVDGGVDIVVDDLLIGSHTLTVSYAGDDGHLASSTTVATQVLKATAGLTATTGPGTYGTSATLTVTGAPGASGLVYVAAGDQVAGFGMMVGGSATIGLSATLPVGTTPLTVFYAGNGDVEPASTTTSVTVAKASTSIKRISVSPSKIVTKRTKPFVELRVSAAGFTVDGGTVTVRASGKKYTGTVRDGKVRIRLGTFTSSGSRKKVTATYSGSSVANGSSTTFTVKVRAR